jgi:hypothetical protein
MLGHLVSEGISSGIVNVEPGLAIREGKGTYDIRR